MAPTVSSIGDARVDAMLVVQVDMVDAEPLEAHVAGGLHVLGPAVDSQEGAVDPAHVRELGRDRHLVAQPPRKAWDRSISLCPAPYMSAVSKKLMPRSTAFLSSSTDARSSEGP